MNEQLIVKNFGPIKDATVDFKRVTVFIGPTGGGKSTLAKLAAIFRNDDWQREPDLNFKQSIFREALNSLSIFDYLKNNGSAYWNASECQATYDAEGLKHNNEERENLFKIGSDIFNRIGIQIESSEPFHIFNYATEQERLSMSIMHGKTIDVFYIPADRSFVAAVDSGLAGLILKDIALPESLLAFLNQFKLAQNWLQVFPLEIPFLNISYRIVDKQPQIDLGEDGTIDLARGASGIQAVTPMMLVINHTISRRRNNAKEPHSFIIEEPELNLYPTAQQGLLNWLVEKCTQGENDLTITTHSPYILSSCNLLLEAYKVAQLRPDLEDEIAAIVPKACWLNPDEFAAYYVADGTVKPITDERTSLIGGNELDAVSGDISDSFRKLLRLKKQVA